MALHRPSQRIQKFQFYQSGQIKGHKKPLWQPSLEHQGSSSTRRAYPAPPALPSTGAAPGLTLLTTMKPLESMLMPLCLRKPVAGTAPGGKPKAAAAVSSGPQPWGLILRPFLLPGQWGCTQGQAAAVLGVWSRARAPTASASGPSGSLSCPSHQCNLLTTLF